MRNRDDISLHCKIYIDNSTVANLGGGLGFNLPEIPKDLQNRTKLNPIVKTVKNYWI